MVLENLIGIIVLGGDDIQLALWAYLNDGAGDNDIKQFFGIETEQGFAATWDKYENNVDNNGNRIYPIAYIAKSKSNQVIYYKTMFRQGNSTRVVQNISGTGREIYEEAMDIYKGESNYSVNSTFYLFKNDKSEVKTQILLILKESGVVEPTPVKLEFYKENSAGEGLAGAKIKIEAYENVEAINSAGDTSKIYDSTGTNGFVGNLIVTPTSDNRNI